MHLMKIELPRKLNQNQVHILKLLYKFRFITPSLLAEHRGVRKSAAQKSLDVLSSYGLVARRYDKSYKIDRRPASYHLTPFGLRYLREHGLNNAVLHARYKDSSVGQNFIDQHLSVVSGLLSIRKQFPDTFQFFTRYETHDQDNFIDPRPDLYLKRKEPHPNKPDEIFVEFIPPHQQNWLTKKCIDEYFKHNEEEGWKTDTYPAILLYASSQSTAEILQSYAAKKKDELYIEDDELSLSFHAQ